MASVPGYLTLLATGELTERVAALQALQSPCRLCPRECGVDRAAGEKGFCRSGNVAVVASCGPHFGEERPLVGQGGSGTIFLTHCNLGCVFCQNCEISAYGSGRETSGAALAQMMLHLQELGCHNINFVTPTHFAPQLVEGLTVAGRMGLRLPVVWNCGGYESVEVLRLLEGIVDIYMPDAKFADSAAAGELCAAPYYPERMRAAITEMHRQVGDLEMDARGIAQRGLLVRHLVMPNGLAGTAAIMQFVAALSPNTYVNVMAQYRPCHRAYEHDAISRRITSREYEDAVRAAREAGLRRLD